MLAFVEPESGRGSGGIPGRNHHRGAARTPPNYGRALPRRRQAAVQPYHLVSIPRREKVRLRVWLGGNDPAVDSLVPVWPGANWLEREIFDLFGIRFLGHPDLRRILLPDDWEGHPLRRDYPVEGYRDVPNTGELFRKSSTP